MFFSFYPKTCFEENTDFPPPPLGIYSSQCLNWPQVLQACEAEAASSLWKPGDCLSSSCQLQPAQIQFVFSVLVRAVLSPPLLLL